MEPIAIIGMACRFPGADCLNDYWHLLKTGNSAIGLVPKERWDVDDFYDQETKSAGKMNTRHGGFINNVDYFDAGFFNISPREAKQMDPQQRLLLELAYEALEDAGIASQTLAGSDTSVYIGVMSNDYLRNQTADNYKNIDVHTGGGAGFCMLANRLSYHFDLHGISAAIDSACSSSLVSIFQACQSLWTNQSSLAFAGGVNLMLNPAFSIFYTKGGLSAPDGCCKTFSAHANGIGRGEGAGLIILKRQSQALADGDHIYATIKGGAVNHGGRSNGITSPNRWAQANLLRSALKASQLEGEQLQYIELHGTGTYIGDPIEANALGEVLKESKRTTPCLVGSVKSNIGHLEGAAGIAGLIKLALCIYHRKIPASLWFDEPNPVIDFDNLPLLVNTELRDWPLPAANDHCYGGINSFGLGGTNAHLILSSPPVAVQKQAITSPKRGYLLLISARSAKALREKVLQYYNLLSASKDSELDAICMTSLRRRDIHEHRLSALGQTRESIVNVLEDYLAQKTTYQWFYAHYKERTNFIRLIVPHVDSFTPEQISQWLQSSPFGQLAWEQCRQQLLLQTDIQLPTILQLPDSVVPDNADVSKIWCFAAQYAMLQQLVETLPTTLTIQTSGMAQLAVCTIAGAISLSAAIDWIVNQKKPLHSGQYHLRCICAGITNPDIAGLDLNIGDLHLSSDNYTMTLVTNIDGKLLPITGALHCLEQHSDNFGYFFARLAMVSQLRWNTLGYDNLIKLPTYPWQRESFWLSAPLHLENRESNPTSETTSSDNIPLSDNNNLRVKLKNLPADERKTEVLLYLRTRVAESLHLAIDQLDETQPLNTLGIDSLTAVEVKNRVEKDLKVTISIVKFLDGYAVLDFADYISAEIESTEIAPLGITHPIVNSESTAFSDEMQHQIAAMSTEQIDALLSQLTQGTV